MPLRELHLVPEPNHNQTRARNPPTETYYLCRRGDNRRVSIPKKYVGVSSSNLLILDSHLYHPRGQELLKLLCRLSPKESFSTDRCSNTSSDLYFFIDIKQAADVCILIESRSLLLPCEAWELCGTGLDHWKTFTDGGTSLVHLQD